MMLMMLIFHYYYNNLKITININETLVEILNLPITSQANWTKCLMTFWLKLA